MRKFVPLFLILTLMFSIAGLGTVHAKPEVAKTELFGKKKKKYKGYQKPKSKKILGIFKRKTDCGCPNH
jgi:hypothetical protein